MAELLTCLGLLVVFCLSACGWGWGASRFMPVSSRLSAAYLATLGLSIWVAIGGLLNAAHIAYPIVLNLILPEELSAEATEEVGGGMSGHGKGKLPR